MTGGARVGYLLFGRVEVFRSGLKKHSDLLTLGDVDWQLNEGLQTQRGNRNDHFSAHRSHLEVQYTAHRVSALQKQAVTTHSMKWPVRRHEATCSVCGTEVFSPVL